jgi:anaerobic magnesium-protoporphyrin IX monomethyl ester cyclase
MRVAVLNPFFGTDFTKSARWFARSRGRVQRHPDYLATAAAVLEEAGHEVFFRDCQAKNEPTADVIPMLRDFQPELCVYQTSTPSIYSDIEAARQVKEAAGGRQVLVGSHVSVLPEETLRMAEGAVDAVCRREYDYTLRDLANGVPLADCAGISWLADGVYHANPDRELIDNLDELPFPAWRHLDLEDYRDGAKLFPFVTLITGRGCRHRCTFCQLPQVMNGRCYRQRSIAHVVDEMEHDLQLFPDLKEIMFEDDTLTMRVARERLVRLCKEIINRGLHRKLSWSANARVDLNDIDILRLMKRSGCRMLCVGFEFGDQTILNNVRKGTKIEQMYTFAENARKAGIRIHGCFMFGGPGETRETAKKTIDLACGLKIDTAQFAGVVAYPGTEYYDWAKREGVLVPEDWRDWVTGDFEQASIINLPELSKDEINEFIDIGLRRFYLRPAQMGRMLLNINSMADVKAKFHGLLSFIGYFRSGTKK